MFIIDCGLYWFCKGLKFDFVLCNFLEINMILILVVLSYLKMEVKMFYLIFIYCFWIEVIIFKVDVIIIVKFDWVDEISIY